MVIDHHHVRPERPRHRQRGNAGGAAIDRDDQLGAIPGQRLDRRRVGAVALEHAIGNVDARLQAMRAEEALHERGRACAIDVVVAEHGNALATHDGIGQPRRPLVHVAQRARVRHQRLDAGVEHHRHLVDQNAARGQHAPQQLGQAVALADGSRPSWRRPDRAARASASRAPTPRRPDRRRRGIIVWPQFADCSHVPPAAVLRQHYAVLPRQAHRFASLFHS